MTSTIRPANPTDFAAMWRIFQVVIAAGDTYVFGAQTSRDDAYAYWFGAGVRSFVAVEDGQILGMYKLVANQRDRGSHVANASFMVATEAQGRGLGRRLGEHCLETARELGFRAMQFNVVVSTNHRAIALWERLGFAIVGTLPEAFQHPELGYIDAYVMYRLL